MHGSRPSNFLRPPPARIVHYRVADERVVEMLDLAHALLEDDEGHIAACCRIEER